MNHCDDNLVPELSDEPAAMKLTVTELRGDWKFFKVPQHASATAIAIAMGPQGFVSSIHSGYR